MMSEEVLVVKMSKAESSLDHGCLLLTVVRIEVSFMKVAPGGSVADHFVVLILIV